MFSATLNTRPAIIVITALILLSLGGLPPLLGFIPKWVAITSFNAPLTPIFLIAGSLLNIFYYLNISLASLLGKHYAIHTRQIKIS